MTKTRLKKLKRFFWLFSHKKPSSVKIAFFSPTSSLLIGTRYFSLNLFNSFVFEIISQNITLALISDRSAIPYSTLPPPVAECK